ncbi:MAG: signal recognition particle receptor subunit alpha, partial [Candidatus Puniceispirillales bacterium]
MSFFGRLKAGLGKTASRLTETITSVVTKKKLDQQTLDELLDALVMSDLGIEASEKLIKSLKSKRFNTEVTEEEIKETLAEGVAEILTPVAIPL